MDKDVLKSPRLIERLEPLEAARQRKREWAQRNNAVNDVQNKGAGEFKTSKTPQSKDKGKEKDKVKNNNKGADAENAFKGDETDADFQVVQSIGEAAPVISIAPPGQFETWMKAVKEDQEVFRCFVMGRKIPHTKFDEYWNLFALEAATKKNTYHKREDISSHFLNYAASKHERSQRNAAGSSGTKGPAKKGTVLNFDNGRDALKEPQTF